MLTAIESNNIEVRDNNNDYLYCGGLIVQKQFQITDFND